MAAHVRHLSLVGGIAAWYIPGVAGLLVVGAAALGALELAVAVAAAGLVAHSVRRGIVVEVSPVGLTRGFVLNGRFIGRTTVIAWDAVAVIHTDWRRRGDDTALATTVSDRHGREIHFTTAMGLGTYWGCLTAVVARAPGALCSGLTAAVVAGERPGRRQLIAVAGTAGALALIIVAVAGVHYLWAQGRSSMARSLEAPPAGATR
jgi:hypothetical protein